MVESIVITHFHLDHWGDLVPWVWGALYLNARDHALPRPHLWVPPTGRAAARAIRRAARLPRHVRSRVRGLRVRAGRPVHGRGVRRHRDERAALHARRVCASARGRRALAGVLRGRRARSRRSSTWPEEPTSFSARRHWPTAISTGSLGGICRSRRPRRRSRSRAPDAAGHAPAGRAARAAPPPARVRRARCRRVARRSSSRPIGPTDTRRMSGWGTPRAAVVFVVGAIATWLAGIVLSKTTDALDVRLGLGEELGGLLLLALAGSLPEVAITVSACAGGHLGLAAGNLIGGIAVQTMVLLICDAFAGDNAAHVPRRRADAGARGAARDDRRLRGADGRAAEAVRRDRRRRQPGVGCDLRVSGASGST